MDDGREHCWMKPAPNEEPIVAKQTTELIHAIGFVLDGGAQRQFFSLSTYSALMDHAASLFARESYECHNSDEHIERHLDEVAEKTKAHVFELVRKMRAKGGH